MRKKIALASTLTATTIGSGVALICKWTKKVLYREQLDEVEYLDWYKDYNGEKVRIKNHKRMFLQGYLFEKEGAVRTVLMVPGLMDNAYDLRDMLGYFNDVLGPVNVFVYDCNAHGLSDGYIRGLGYRDVSDLMYMNRYILQRYGDNHRMIMYGQGTGANTILNAASLDKLKNVDCILSDGAYDDAYHYLTFLCQRDLKVFPMLCGPIIRRTIKSEIDLDIKKLNTALMVKRNKIPTAFIHVKDDMNVPFQCVFPLYNRNQSYKLLFPIKHDSLLECLRNESDYHKQLIVFMNENMKEV